MTATRCPACFGVGNRRVKLTLFGLRHIPCDRCGGSGRDK